MTSSPSLTQRAWAGLALLALALAIAYLGIALLDRWNVLVIAVVSLSAAIIGGWYVITRRGGARGVAVFVSLGAMLAFVITMLATDTVRILVVGIALTAGSILSAERALRPSASDGVRTSGMPGAASKHAVLLMNLKSGGGKAERFQLAERCRERDITPIVLQPGDDLLQLAEGAVAGGADVIGMAGGDGSQALVASVASRHGIPMVVIPSGTRNHFALDLGIDREDVIGALDAYSDGVDRVIDLADVNGRVFVNNTSMGVYAKVVQSPEYRDAKMQTTATILPEVIGPDAQPMDLRLVLPSGDQISSAQLILVSNNPYALRHLRGWGTRERIDTGTLGIVTLLIEGPADAQRFLALAAAGQPHRFQGWHEWEAEDFEVQSSKPIEIGIDGEAVVLEPPLRFTVMPQALTVRLPRQSVGVSPAAAAVRLSSSAVHELWNVVRGRSAS